MLQRIRDRLIAAARNDDGMSTAEYAQVRVYYQLARLFLLVKHEGWTWQEYLGACGCRG
ncbi:DUF4244 domain-containing protein [Longimycelium tulufanense]|nr:DUF4244 domain-containing protein [Longimycelium tulufanense]